MEIYTFDARNNVTWNVIKGYFSLDNTTMHKEISDALENLKDILKNNNLEYSSFKNVLIPLQDKMDVFFVYDSEKTVNKSCYGYEILDSIIPELMNIEKVSVFYGDIIGGNTRESQLRIKKELQKSIPNYDFTDYQYSNQYFVVYLTNITKKMKTEIDIKQIKCQSYIGCIDMSFSCYLKNVLSMCIGVRFIKIKNKICVPTPLDDMVHPRVYLHFDCSELDYEFIGIEETLFSSFLSYKIERSYFEFDNEDQLLALNAIIPDPVVLSNYEIEIDDKKLEYLRNKKKGTLQITRLDELSKENLIVLLQHKINTNYIFNISFNNSYNCLKFATLIEIRNDNNQRKYLAAFEINIPKKRLRLISMY